MDWEDIKDIKVLGAIITFVGFVVGVVTQTRSDNAESALKRAEAKKINQELKDNEKQIEELKTELRRIKAAINKMIDQIIKTL